jgi:hypothetical protein
MHTSSSENMKGRENLINISVDGKRLLKCTLNKVYVDLQPSDIGIKEGKMVFMKMPIKMKYYVLPLSFM